jgi:hypothetical protein
MSRGGHDIGKGDRIKVPGEHVSGHQPGEMGHVDHERGSDLVGDLGQGGEIGVPRICRVSSHDYKRAKLPGLGRDGAVVEEPGGGIDPVAGLVEELPRDVGPEPVGEMPTGVECHPHHALGMKIIAQPVPACGVKVVHVTHAGPVQGGLFDPMSQNGPVGDEVGVDPGVWLDVGMIGTKECLGVVGSQGLDPVDHLAPGVEAMARGALGVLVR